MTAEVKSTLGSLLTWIPLRYSWDEEFDLDIAHHQLPNQCLKVQNFRQMLVSGFWSDVRYHFGSVPESDPYVFGPPGSASGSE
jgi:hypothetical protein